MTEQELAGLRQQLNGNPAATAGSQTAHGHAEGRVIPFADPSSPTRVLLIASGKGGVGKSSVTTNLAVALAERGKEGRHRRRRRVGLLHPPDARHRPPPVLIDSMLVPPDAHGVRAISMGFFAEEDQAVIWRGPMLHKALEQFLTDVFWDDPDYLLVDLPPGTGDISISLSQFLPRAEVYVVTTPQPAAQRVAQRAAAMADKVHLEVKGIIENMAWFTGDDGQRYEIFGAGGGQELADKIDVPLLGQIPLVSELREGSDSGDPIVAGNPTSEAGQAFTGHRRAHRRRAGPHPQVPRRAQAPLTAPRSAARASAASVARRQMLASSHAGWHRPAIRSGDGSVALVHGPGAR